MSLSERPELLGCFSDSDLRELSDYLEDLDRVTPLWTPIPGPQSIAYKSPADEVYYGGAAGGGKSDLLLGLATTAHKDSIVFRRKLVELKGPGGLIERSKRIIGRDNGSFNANDRVWRLNDGRIIEFGAMEQLDDWMNYQGRPHDLLEFDELPHFHQDQYRSLIAWCRTTDPRQRCRVVGAGNPPLNADQQWVIVEWAPWLEETFPHPAEPCELRWYFIDPETEATKWVETGDTIRIGKRTIKPRSRTFIPASVDDNPILMATGYSDTLDSLPEPLRSILKGSFKKGTQDDAYQVVPTEWIKISFDRYKRNPGGWKGLPLQCLGVDPVWGGKDCFAACPRRGFYFPGIVTHPGREITSGSIGAQKVWDILKKENNPHQIQTNLDVIGYGSATYEACCRMRIDAVPINVSMTGDWTDRTGNLMFANLRAYGYWGLRELFDPENGFNMAVCPDNMLLQELTAHRFEIRAGGVIRIEEKKDISKRIGRSPDRAEAMMLSTLARPKGATDGGGKIHQMG